MRYYCTYFDSQYLLRAVAMLQSLRTHETEPFRVYAVCLDEYAYQFFEQAQWDYVIPIRFHEEIEQHDAELRSAKEGRTIAEYCWTCTPTIIRHCLLRDTSIAMITYLDADLFFYSSPQPIFDEFGSQSVLIHEHRFPQRLQNLAENGIYNVGLMCFRNDATARTVLDWWRDRCIEWCYATPDQGRMGDQGYLNDWTTRFANVHVLRHVGAGIAPWNHDDYAITKQSDGTVLIDNDRLVFYHFHAMCILAPTMIIPSKHRDYHYTSAIIEHCCVPYFMALAGAQQTILALNPTLLKYDSAPADYPRLCIHESAVTQLQSQLQSVSVVRSGVWSFYGEVFENTLPKHTPQQQTQTLDIAVSAIVSVYNARLFIQGCLDDLIAQTLFQRSGLEIIVIISGSPEHEEDIVAQYAEKYPSHIRWVRTERETLYAAWNRAIRMAQGRYITNANADDRHRPDALALMAEYLDTHTDIGVVYGDQFISDTPNETFAQTSSRLVWGWPEFSYQELERRNIVGPQPMWRARIHAEHGYFLDGFKVAADYEFWLRIGRTVPIKKMPHVLGVYYRNTVSGLELAHGDTATQETNAIRAQYRILERGVVPIGSHPVELDERITRLIPYHTALPTKPHTVVFSAQILSPVVSIIIPTMGTRPAMLLQAINSVQSQNFASVEIIVVSDGGADMQAIIQSLPTERVTYIQLHTAHGVSAARNIGIAHARGQYIGYLDDDDILYPHHISTLVQALQSGTDHAVYSTSYRAVQTRNADGSYTTTERTITHNAQCNLAEMLVGNFTPILCVMHERHCVEVIGGFDERLNFHEDWELWIRMNVQFPFRHIPEITCEYTWRTDGSTATSSKYNDMLRTTGMIYDWYAPMTDGHATLKQAQKNHYAWMQQQRDEHIRTHSIQISIIIITHNNLDYTKQCLASIRATVGSLRHEIIVVDNCSTDGTQAWLQVQSDVHVILNTANESFSHANNQGAEIAKGQYFIFLNNDTKVLPGALQALYNHFETHPTTAIQGAKLLYENDTIQHAGMVYGVRGNQPAEPYHAYLALPAHLPFVNRERTVQFVTGACLAMRAEIFKRVQGFDETYFFGWEDTDLCMKINARGWHIIYNPQACLYHYESITKRSVGADMTNAQAPHEIRNREHFMQKWRHRVREDADHFYAEDGIMVRNNALHPLTQEHVDALRKQNPTSFSAEYWTKDYTHARSIVVLLGGAIGDALCMTSVLYALHQCHAHLQIHVSAPALVCSLFQGLSFIASAVESNSAEARTIYSQSDILLDYTNRIARLPEYYNGIGFRDILGNLAGVRHEDYRIHFAPTTQEQSNAHALLQKLCGTQSREQCLLVAVQFHTDKDAKRSYPHGEQVVQSVLRVYSNARIIVFGTTPLAIQDDRIIHAYQQGATLREQMLLVQECDAVIAIDSALFHLGHALHNKRGATTPTLLLCGLTNPALIGNPQRGFYALQNTTLSCLHCYWQTPCQIECLHHLAPALVAESFIAMLLHQHDTTTLLPQGLQHSQSILREQPHRRITITETTNIHALFAEIFAERNGVRITLEDAHHILPAYATQWNGTEVVQEEKQGTIINTDVVIEQTFHSSNPSDMAEQSKPSIGFSGAGHQAPERATGVLPSPLPNPLYLNLGCGDDVRQGFVNIDLFGNDPRIVAMDVRRITIESEFVDGIIASDVLQQIPHRDIPATLREWARLLKPTGECVLRVPSFPKQAQHYIEKKWSAEQASNAIFGEQKTLIDANRTAFDADSLRTQLIQAGFEVSRIEEQADASTGTVYLIGYAKKSAFQDFLATQQKQRVIQPIGFERPAPIEHPASAHPAPAQASAQAAPPEVVPPVQPQPVQPQPVQVVPPNIVPPVQPQPVQPQPQKDIHIEQTPIQDSTPPTTAPTGKQANVVWEGAQFLYSSFATINREHAHNLLQCAGIELTVIPFGSEQFSPIGHSRYEPIHKQDIRYKDPVSSEIKKLPYIWVRHTWPPKTDKPPGAKWVLMQPWEFSTVRKDLYEAAMSADEVWTPSHFARSAFLRSGIPADKVQVIPNGVRTDIFTPFGTRAELPTKKRFKFLYIGGTTFRKGIDLLLQAYAQAFTSADDVTLIIKGMGGDTFYKNSHVPMDDLIAEFRKTPNAPEIWYMDTMVPDEQVADLIRACDVFVSPSRGEGFSMPTLEAMACGKPVIVTEGMGMDDFVDEEVGWLLPSEQVPLDGIKEQLVGEAYLLVPRIDDIITALQYAYQHPIVSATKGMDAALRARTEWTWSRATLKALHRMDTLVGTSLAKQSEHALADKEDGIIAFGKAEQEYFAGRVDEAIELYHVAIRMGGLSEQYAVLALHRLASFCIQDKQFGLAEECLEKCDLISADHPDTMYLEATIARLRGEYETAIMHFTSLMDGWKYHRFVSRLGITLDLLLCECAECLYRENGKEEARDMFALAVEVNADNINAWFGAGVCMRDLGDTANARIMLERALAIDPDFAPAQQELADMQS